MHTNKNYTISFNNKPFVTSTQIANSFNKQFTNTVPHTSNKTNRKIDKQVHKLPKTTFILTTSEISAAIRNSKNNNSTGPDGISIRHLKHIGPLGLTYLTNTFNLALNTNTIPHMWKLANIIPILKPDKDHNTGTSYRPISLLSVISKTLEKALLPYITNNIPQHHTQHGFKAKHSTTTALHNINNTIASGFNQRIPPARTIAVALDMSKAFDTVNIHTLTKKLLDTQIPPILIKFIANYIKGGKAFTTYNNKTSTQRQFKTGVPQGGVLSPTLFNIYTSDIPSPPPNINITVYADDITMTSTDTNKQIAQAKLQPYLQEIASWTQQNQLHLNPDKTTSTLFTPDPAEYSTQLTLNIDNVVIPTVKNPKILGLTFDPKLTYNAHIRKTSDKARNTLKLLKALTSTKWGKQKETIVATYKAITRPILEYASTIWSPIASTTGITKLQTIQNMALRIATGCTSDTNIQHLHNETNILPLSAHLKLHSSQLRQKSQHPTHPLHKFTVLTENERHKKQTIFDNNNNYTVNINMKSDLICEDLIQSNLKLIHSHIVSNYLSQRPPNKVLQDQTPSVSPAELLLSRETRRTLAQLRTNKSPLVVSYLFSIGDPRHPSPLFPLCLMHDHTSSHLFECKSLPTSLSSLDLWTNPDKVEPFLATWGRDCWLPHDSGAGLCWQHVGAVGSTTTTTTTLSSVERKMQPARGRFARSDLDRQMASTFPCPLESGPSSRFWASRPLEPAELLALLILKAGDVESNPGPQNRKLPTSALTTQTTTLNSTTHSHATTSHHNQKLLTLLQLNINSITNKHEELKLLVTELQPDIITIQETKLKKHNKTPQIPTYSAIRTDRANGKGGGLLTYIKHNITFSDTKIHNFINPINTELQIIQLHITNNKIYTIANIYTPLGTPLARITPPVMLISHLAFNT